MVAFYADLQLCLLIDGAVPLDSLFAVLNEQVDPLILRNLPSTSSPMVTTVCRDVHCPPCCTLKPQTRIVEFMEQDESIGEIYLNFLGPPPMDYRTNTALKLLGAYLTDTATAPLQVEFVEIKQPLCTGIGIYSEDRVNHNEITLYLTDVPVKHLETLSGDVVAKLNNIVSEGVDMDRMSRVIRRDKRKLLNMMETSVSDVLADAVIGGESQMMFVAHFRLPLRFH